MIDARALFLGTGRRSRIGLAETESGSENIHSAPRRTMGSGECGAPAPSSSASGAEPKSMTPASGCARCARPSTFPPRNEQADNSDHPSVRAGRLLYRPSEMADPPPERTCGQSVRSQKRSVILTDPASRAGLRAMDRTPMSDPQCACESTVTSNGLVGPSELPVYETYSRDSARYLAF
jgi:hypothetical protein